MFGNENADSKYAWKAKYEQASQHANGLQQRIHELQGVINEYEEAINKLIESNKGLEQDNGYLRKMIEEKDSELNASREPVSKQNKTTLQASQIVSPISSQSNSNSYPIIQSLLIPMMLREFHEDDSDNFEIFQQFVEAVIQEGQTEAKIVGLLVKHGGKGPINKVKERINSSDFDFALDQLTRSNIIKIHQNEIILSTIFEGGSSEMDWDSMDVPDMFETLQKIVETTPPTELAGILEGFRDSLQNRDIPATTVFFSIRKTIERVKKDNITVNALKKEINEWAGKILGSF